MKEDSKNGYQNNLYLKLFDENETKVKFSVDELEKYGRGIFDDSFYIRTARAKPWYKASLSIVICTYGRPESLNDTLESLTHQTFRNFEVILITEKGHLAELRQRGLETSGGSIVSFIDDDVYCPPTWAQGVMQSFREGVVGVTGPTTITEGFKKNRDCFKYKRLRKAQEWLFKVPTTPGQLSPCGAPSMASNDEGCSYEGSVMYLECCNMSVKRKEALDVGGFDLSYTGTSEWCEVDLALKIARTGSLLFVKTASLFHRPSIQGIYKARIKTKHRWENFKFFQRRWIKRSLRRDLYWAFIWTYFRMKELATI